MALNYIKNLENHKNLYVVAPKSTTKCHYPEAETTKESKFAKKEKTNTRDKKREKAFQKAKEKS